MAVVALVLAAGLALTGAPAAAADAAPAASCAANAPCVLVFRVEPKAGVVAADAERVAAAVVAALRAATAVRVDALADVRARISAEQARADARGCTEYSCVAELGRALGVPFFVSGDVGRLGLQSVLNLTMARTADDKPVGRVSIRVRGDVAALLDAVDADAVRPLAAALPGGIPPPELTDPPIAAGGDGAPAPADEPRGDPFAEPPVRIDLPAPVRAAVYGRDGRVTAAGSEDGVVRVWSRGRPAPLRLAGPTAGITAVAFDPGAYVVTAGAGNGAVYLWRTRDGARLRTYTGHAGAVAALVFVNDTRFVSVGADGTVRVWDAVQGGEVHRFDGHVGPVKALAAVGDGAHVVTAGDDGTVRLWNTFSRAPGFVARPEGLYHPRALTVSPRGARIAVAGADGVVHLLKADGNADRRLRGPGDTITALRFVSEGALLAAVSSGVRRMHADTGRMGPPIVSHFDTVWSIDLRRDRRRLLTAGYDGALRVTSLSDGAAR